MSHIRREFQLTTWQKGWQPTVGHLAHLAGMPFRVAWWAVALRGSVTKRTPLTCWTYKVHFLITSLFEKIRHLAILASSPILVIHPLILSGFTLIVLYPNMWTPITKPKINSSANKFALFRTVVSAIYEIPHKLARGVGEEDWCRPLYWNFKIASGKEWVCKSPSRERDFEFCYFWVCWPFPLERERVYEG